MRDSNAVEMLSYMISGKASSSGVVRRRRRREREKQMEVECEPSFVDLNGVISESGD